jgi:uncharacterized protein (DUF1501 family)
MNTPHILTRRNFFTTTTGLAATAALSSLTDVPLFVQKALAEGGLGQPGANGRVKKLLFIFLRGANDGLNNVIPHGDDAYGPKIRDNIAIPVDPTQSWSVQGKALFPEAGTSGATFAYPYSLPLGNGFAGLHPALKFLTPVYNAGELALIHRVAYPQQSRSHFDSQSYWETGAPRANMVKDGLLYRAMVESGRPGKNSLTGVSFQNSLPLLLRGSRAAMTNLSDPTRYDLLGVPNTADGNLKAARALEAATGSAFPSKANRDLLQQQYENMRRTLEIFAGINFSETGNTFVDGENTDGNKPYYLFPTTNAKNGAGPSGATNPGYVVPTSAYGYFNQLKSAALVLNKTDALVAGTQIDGWDTHSNQGGATGAHANLLQRVGWSIYALRQYFRQYADQCRWDDLVIVTLSEFGRTTIENSDNGTDHAEASVMYVAGGGIKGLRTDATGKVTHSGVFNCGPSDPVPWQTGMTGSMFQSTGRYLQRATDFRSVMGKVVRDHLGASQEQLNRIIPGYADLNQSLKAGGIQSQDKVRVTGEPDLI